ncbi:MAG: DUF177 domain-containing protein [Acidobacteria bacterium]|nr:DUF177 domain-containing protein [Acidobacteriota bacterium]MCA1650983.1 DUF177 domain-containing protein [Acidobacteriota bacterium]
MLLDLNNLHGPRARVDRTFQPSAFDPPDDDYRVAAPVVVSMDVQKVRADTFRVSGRAVTRLELSCSRCIEPFEVPVEVECDLQYLPQTENQGDDERELADEDLGTAFYRDGTLDIAELLREQFQLALPMKPLCDAACRGLCAECGANLNRADCGCAPKWEDPRLAPLKGLLNRPKEI